MNEEEVRYYWFQCGLCGKLFDTEEALHLHEKGCESANASCCDGLPLFMQ